MSLKINATDGTPLGVWHLWEPIQSNCTSFESSYYPSISPNDPVFVYFHGNGGNRGTSHRVAFYQLLFRLGADLFNQGNLKSSIPSVQGMHIVIVDYRDFGDSTSEQPTEAGLLSDARGVWDYVIAQGAQNVYLIGHSLGSAVAVHLATSLAVDGPQSSLSGVILVAPITSALDAAQTYPFNPVAPLIWAGGEMLQDLVKDYTADTWMSKSRIHRINSPLFIVHGENDWVVPVSHGKSLFLASLQDSSPEKVWESKDGIEWNAKDKSRWIDATFLQVFQSGHNDVHKHSAYLFRLSNWISLHYRNKISTIGTPSTAQE
jgi:abhydrolase domain-containing protein 12